MTTIYAKTSDQVLISTVMPRIACNNQNTVRLHVDFDSPWEGYVKSAVFHTSMDPTPYEVIFSSDGNCIVPAEVLADEAALYIGVRGVKTASGEVKSSAEVKYKVLPGTPSVVISAPAPNVYQQLLTENAVLKSRLSELEAGGSVDGDEVIGIRTGADGIKHPTAGDAVRAQYSVLHNDQRFNNESERTTFTPFAVWVIGGLSNAQTNTAYGNRIATSNVLHFDRDIEINIADGFRVGFHTVDQNGVFVADSGWKQGAYKIKADTYFKLVIARVSEVSEPADVVEFSKSVTFNTFAGSKFSEIDHALRIQELVNKATIGNAVEVKGVRYTTSNAQEPNNRIHSADIECEALAIIELVDKNKEYYYGIDLYTNDGNRSEISKTGWMKMEDNPFFIVSQPCIIDIVLRNYSSSSFDDLSEMDGLFNVTVYNTVANIQNAVNPQSGKKRKCWLTSAHRGFVDSLLKENSLAAYYNAYLNGADMIETDAWLSSDGVLIVNHDPTVTAKNESGETVTYTIADTPSDVLCSLILSSDDTWGVQKVPTLEQVLNLAYHTGLIVNIDMKNGYASVDAIVSMVVKCGMCGRVIYALNGSGMTGINTILAKDPEARFIDGVGLVSAVANYADRRTRCFAYTSDLSAETVKAIRDGGCMVALISLHAGNFEAAISQHPDMCEYLHTSNFKAIEDEYFKNTKLY